MARKSSRPHNDSPSRSSKRIHLSNTSATLTATTSPNTSQTAATSSKSTRGRGRPRKSSTTTPEASVPARPGRPRKRSTPASESKQKRVKFDTIDANGKADGHVEIKNQPIEQEDDFEEDGSQYWLMKAEPESRIEKGKDVKFSIDDLRNCSEPEAWDGVRNPVARNNMRAMKQGDLAFFYHSNCKNPGIVGLMKIVQEHSVDESAFDKSHPYYDPKSSPDKPKWDVVHVEFVRKFPEQIDLSRLKSFAQPGGVLAKMQMLIQSRLSVSAVRPKEWNFIMGLVTEDSQGESRGSS